MTDILQQDQEQDWWKPKSAFDLGSSGVTFNSFVLQNELLASDSNVKVSYYRKGDELLAYVANFNNFDWTGHLSFDLTRLGVVGLRATDAETASPLSITNQGLGLFVQRHNCRVLRLGK